LILEHKKNNLSALVVGAKMSSENQEIQGLVAALIAKTREMAATEHIGHLNRLVEQRERIYAAIEALPEGHEALLELFHSPDPHVQLDVARHCKYKKIVLEAALDTLRRLAERRDKIGDDAKWSLQFQPTVSVAETIQVPARNRPYLPPPSGCDRRKAEALISDAFPPERTRSLVELLRPAIRIWPKKSAGGLPAVPRDGRGLPSVRSPCCFWRRSIVPTSARAPNPSNCQPAVS
jgi:hypothetical protein